MLSKSLILKCCLIFLSAYTVFAAQAAPEHEHTHDQEFILASKNEQYAQEVISNVGAEEVFRRTEFILRHFDSPPEQNYQTYLNTLNANTPTGIIDYLKSVLDPTGQFDRIFTERDSKVHSFIDRDAKRLQEYSVKLVDKQHHRHSLRGLRVAIDPGHMGGDLWDKRTGKHVTDGSQKVSEGVIALQTALLLEEHLSALGARVLLTRRSLRPVTNTKYEDLDVNYFARRELRARSMEPWFLDIIQKNRTERELISAFTNSTNFKKLFAERSRLEYFAQREDLYARNVMLAEFKPHITKLSE
jgi:N-acetylmuramoyl-L-alanine amidase